MIEPRPHTPARAAPHEAKFTALDMKSIADDGGFEGYASLFGREDLGRDVVMAGAFRDSIAARGPSGVRMLFQHNPAEPIGVWETLAEDAKGLFVRGRLMPAVARAREVLSLMRAGAIDGLSIGFRTVKAHRDRHRGVRRIEKIDLWEISIVTFPLLPEARIAAIKSRPFAHCPPIGTRIRALAHAGRWADALRGQGGAPLRLQGSGRSAGCSDRPDRGVPARRPLLSRRRLSPLHVCHPKGSPAP